MAIIAYENNLFITYFKIKQKGKGQKNIPQTAYSHNRDSTIIFPFDPEQRNPVN